MNHSLGAPLESVGVDSVRVAEQIRWLRDQAGIPTTPMQILKLVYIAHGWMLGIVGDPLIRQDVEAWKYGPVVPEVYHRYKPFGGFPIVMSTREQDELPPDQLALVAAVERVYRRFNGLQLSTMTHQPGSPWHITVQKYGKDANAVIRNELIRRHYRSLLARRQLPVG